jgi:hypothetical protein
MEKEQTLRILNALANGVHPATGEKFAADSPYQHPDTVRALFEALRAVEGGGPAAERKSALPQSGSGSRWTREEEQRLAAAFDAGKSVDELARAHSRSRVAIEARLVRLGKLDASAVTMPMRYPPKPPGYQARQGG